MFRIGYRTLKTAIGTALAILIAQLFGLDNFTSAGILTILCVQETKRKSLRSSWERFLACTLGMIVASLMFEVIAYHPLTIGLILVLYIPVLVMLNARDGVVTSAVIIMHIFAAGNVTIDLLLNELGIIIIGVGVALGVNLYMPSVEKKLRLYRQDIEKNFAIILKEMVKYLRVRDTSWGGREITETEKLLNEAMDLAFRDIENRFSQEDQHYYHYFKMREKQFEILERLLLIVPSITYAVEQGEMIAEFMEEVSNAVNPGNTANIYLTKLEKLRLSFKEMPLPQTRDEFEVRAALLQFINEMEQFLLIKHSFNGVDQ